MSSLRRSRLLATKANLPPGSVPDGTRRRILELSLRLFSREGFHGTSVRDIAKVAELGPSALYVHFPSKDHILAELVRLGYEIHAATLAEARQSAGDDPVDQVCAIVRAHAVTHATYPHLAIIVNEELYALSPELAAPALKIRARSAALLQEIVERGAATGRFSVSNVMATAAALGAIGVRIPYWYEASSGLTVEALADIQVELSLRMLGVRGPLEPALSRKEGRS